MPEPPLAHAPSPAPPRLAEAFAELATEIRRVLSAGWTGVASWLEERLTVTEVARLIGIPVSTLYKLNSTGGGPLFEKLATGNRGAWGDAGAVRFRRADVLAWLETKKVDPLEKVQVRKARRQPRRRPVASLAALRGRAPTHKTSSAPMAVEAPEGGQG